MADPEVACLSPATGSDFLSMPSPRSKSGIPEPVETQALMEAMEGKPESNSKYRLAVRGHFLLVLDDAPGSRTVLREMELIGLEVCSKAGGEGIPPMLGLKRMQAGLGPEPCVLLRWLARSWRKQ